jgi:fused signal recognition particle receptor
MFGFLKDKLKKAIDAFTKSAKSDVKEEKVEDAQAIERAKEEERRILARAKPSAKLPEPKKEEKRIEEKKPSAQQPQKAPEPPKKVPKKEEEKTKESIDSAQHLPRQREARHEEKKEETTEGQKPPSEERKGFLGRLFGKKEERKEEASEVPRPKTEPTPAEPVIEEGLEQVEEDIEEGPGLFGKIKDAFTKKTLTPEKFDGLFWELEVAMLENNVAVEVIEKIKGDLKDELTTGKVSRLGIDDMITARLRRSIEDLFDVPTFDLLERIKRGPRPFKICIIGVNGSGKTTTLAKIVHLLQKNGLSCVVAASDTFRAAAIDQLKEHCDRLGVKLISQGYGADPAAVAFDAIRHAESKGIDVVLIDTAGRLHSNTNLMQELEKVVRVSKPHLKIFVGESITGNDCVEQAQVFGALVGIDAIILSKADIDEKGGAAISVSYVTKRPILYLGMGQAYDDLVPFDKEKILESLEL